MVVEIQRRMKDRQKGTLVLCIGLIERVLSLNSLNLCVKALNKRAKTPLRERAFLWQSSLLFTIGTP